jgi:hypothetical protein
LVKVMTAPLEVLVGNGLHSTGLTSQACDGSHIQDAPLAIGNHGEFGNFLR